MKKIEFENLKYEIILFSLKTIGVEKITFDYSGEHDSGAIDEISFFDSNENAILLDNEYDKRINDLEDSVYDILMCVSDWYNNDGGGGYIEISTNNGKYIIHNNVRVITYHNEQYEGTISHFKENKDHKHLKNII